MNRILLVFIIFFFLSALFIISNNNLAMHKQENLLKFSQIYLGWLEGIYSNVVKVTGYVVKLDWIPQ